MPGALESLAALMEPSSVMTLPALPVSIGHRAAVADLTWSYIHAQRNREVSCICLVDSVPCTNFWTGACAIVLASLWHKRDTPKDALPLPLCFHSIQRMFVVFLDLQVMLRVMDLQRSIKFYTEVCST